MIKLFGLLTLALVVGLVAISHPLPETEATNDRLDKDPINGANVRMLNAQIYYPNYGYGRLTLETGFIKRDQFYIRISSDASRFTFQCYYGAVWDHNGNGGCLGERNFDHYNNINVVPQYQKGYIIGWEIQSGDNILAHIVAHDATFYLASANTFAK
jgi:hypothetical protein